MLMWSVWTIWNFQYLLTSYQVNMILIKLLCFIYDVIYSIFVRPSAVHLIRLMSQHVRHVTMLSHHSNELRGDFKEELPSQVLLSAARWRPGGHRQCTSPSLSFWQPNWQRREKHVASSGKQTGEHWLKNDWRNRPLGHGWKSTLSNRTTAYRTRARCPQHWDPSPKHFIQNTKNRTNITYLDLLRCHFL